MLIDINDLCDQYQSCYRKGSYFKRVAEQRLLTQEELNKIPEKRRTNSFVTRNTVKQVEFCDLYTINENILFF